jgi:hypothetical protein
VTNGLGMNLEIGTQVGDYLLLSRIGKGSYGVVYEAEHAITRRRDALKLMLYTGPCAADDEQRFLREIQLQASLQHPNIASVYTAFRTEWGPALAMELVRGESLRAILERRTFRLEEGIGYMQAALCGLAAAERLGIVHRDVKPENILITQDGKVKLTDFGLAHVMNGARLTGSGENIGTPCYMSPEQVVGNEPVDSRSDVYAAGVVLYEIVTGQPPFTGTNGFAVMLAHRNTPPVPPIDVNPATGEALNQVILKALEKDPSKRFHNAGELCNAVELAMAEREHKMVGIPAPHPGRPSPWRWVAVTAAAAAGGCGLLFFVAHMATRHVEARANAVPAKPSTAVVQPVQPAPPPAPVVEPPQAVAMPPEPSPAPEPVEKRKRAAKPEIVAKPAQRAVRRPVPAPAATQPRFTSTDAPDPLAKRSAEAAKPPSSPSGAAFEAPAPTAPLPTSAAPAASPVIPADPPPDADPAAETTGKRRNPIVRAFGKIFGRHNTTKTDSPKAEK